MYFLAIAKSFPIIVLVDSTSKQFRNEFKAKKEKDISQDFIEFTIFHKWKSFKL